MEWEKNGGEMVRGGKFVQNVEGERVSDCTKGM